MLLPNPQLRKRTFNYCLWSLSKEQFEHLNIYQPEENNEDEHANAESDMYDEEQHEILDVQGALMDRPRGGERTWSGQHQQPSGAQRSRITDIHDGHARSQGSSSRDRQATEKESIDDWL